MYACVNVCVCVYSPASIGSLSLISSCFKLFLRIWSHSQPSADCVEFDSQGSPVTSGEVIRNLVSAHSKYLCVHLLLIFLFEVDVSVTADFPVNWSQCKRPWKHPIFEGVVFESLSLLRRLPLESFLRWSHYLFQFLRTERVERWRRTEGESFIRLEVVLDGCVAKVESGIKRSFSTTQTTFHGHTLAWVNIWGTPTHKSTTALCMHRKHVYMCVLLAFTTPHTKWYDTDVYSGATLFNVPRQDLLRSRDLHPDLNAQASTGPRSTERRWLSTAELRCV